jgi:hypothetical protein
MISKIALPWFSTTTPTSRMTTAANSAGCGKNWEEQSRIIKRNMRAILQLFNVSVIVFPDRVEIKGNIPQQVLYQGEAPEPETALFISSASPSIRGRGKCFAAPSMDAGVRFFGTTCLRMTGRGKDDRGSSGSLCETSLQAI